MYTLMQLLVSLGYAVTLYCEDEAPSAEDVERLRAIDVHVLFPVDGYPHWLLDATTPYSAIIVCRYHLAWHWMPLLRHALPHALQILDTVDLHHLRERREAYLHQSALRRTIAAQTRRHEMRMIRHADATWVVSTAERDYLHDLVPDAQIDVVPNLHDYVDCIAPFDGRSGLLFVGGGRHPPNIDAITWLLREIFPRIRAQLPDVHLHVVGDGIVEAAGIVRERHPGVMFHGHVPDLASLLATCRISIAPLRFGAGVKGKVTQALVHGLPVVTTPIGAEGLQLESRTHAMIEDAASALASAAVDLHENPALWQRLSDNGRLIMRQRFSLDQVRATLAARLPAPTKT
ncbi:glycosyltransferase [Luteimonas fraxinea]|uniref:Glycosyltransferase n=2 Tax=Luteimonas fraxinea TaxID=2901869 RepID=A0ABS8UAD3_9GAMM|nr:glycosyltransferase [Luteimonas fraxinea]MCD9095852.1 glycosyltransferase [Luteimonas fraxinea]MCD9124441.1 glycosyltransferase [Luteimonas fraxinea]UHH10969.1 glycosyltransferase [Luteimonas fraxinea]